MTTRALKLLTASTAFIAAASAANAVTITTPTTASVYTSETGPVSILGSGAISVTGGSAIYISNTLAASNTITIGTGATVAATSATIVAESTANGAVTITNSGTIIGAGNGSGYAINLGGMVNNNTVHNTGLINGYVLLGNGTNTFTTTGGTVSGTVMGASGNDTITFTNSTLNGNIETDDGTDNVTINNSTVNGTIDSGTGTTTLTLTDSTVNGEIKDRELSDQDVLTINGTKTFTTGGAISGFENVTFDTTTNLNHGLSDANKVSIGTGKTLNVANSFATGAGGTLGNSGTLNIEGGKTVTAGTYAGAAGSNIGIGLISSHTTAGIGKLELTNGILAGGTSVTINLATTAGYISSGTQYVIAQGNAAAANVSLTNASSGVYRFSTATSNTDVVLNVGRVSTTSVVNGSNAQNVAAVLDGLGTNTSGTLTTVQSVIGQQTTAAGVTNVANSLTPGIEGAGAASLQVTTETGNQVSNRLASLRGTGTGIATGDGIASSHMWMQGFGGSTKQDDKDGNFGYDATSGGVSMGIDTDTMFQGLTTGVAVSYGRASVDSNSTNNASTDIDSYLATLYGSRVFDSGVFLNGQLGYAYNQYDMERTIMGVGTAKGKTNGWQGTAKVEGGRDFAVGGFTFTPLASLQYTYLDIDGYTETGVGGAGLRVNPDALSTVDAGAGAQLAYAIPLQNGGTLKPSVHAKYIYRFGDDQLGTTSAFTGGGATFNTQGVEADKSSVNIGAGLILTTVAGTDLSLNYDADIRSSMTGHAGQMKARWAF